MAEIVTLTLPPRPESLRVARQVVASVAANLHFPYDAVDDLRLAADEACAYLLALEPQGSMLGIRITSSRARVEILAFTDATPDGWPPGDPAGSLPWQVLTALVDEARFERQADGPAIRLRKRRVRTTS